MSVTSELNPGTLRFYDVLLLILIRLVDAVSDTSVIGFEDTDLPKMLDWVRDHLARKWTKHLRIDGAEFGAGLNIPFLRLFGNIKQGRTREAGEEEYELSFVSELVELMNRLLQESTGSWRASTAASGWSFSRILKNRPRLIRTEGPVYRPSARPEGLDGHFIS